MCSVYGLSGPDQAFDRSLKPLSKLSRQHCPSLCYVDLEACIEARIKVDRSSSELHMLVKRPHPAPSATLDHAVRAVDVEALLGVPLPRTRMSVEGFLTGESLARRQIERLKSAPSQQSLPSPRRCRSQAATLSLPHRVQRSQGETEEALTLMRSRLHPSTSPERNRWKVIPR